MMMMVMVMMTMMTMMTMIFVCVTNKQLNKKTESENRASQLIDKRLLTFAIWLGGAVFLNIVFMIL